MIPIGQIGPMGDPPSTWVGGLTFHHVPKDGGLRAGLARTAGGELTAQPLLARSWQFARDPSLRVHAPERRWVESSSASLRGGDYSPQAGGRFV